MRFLNLFALLVIMLSFQVISHGQEASDSLTAEVLKIMKDKLSRTDQLEVLDYAMKSEFDVPYEVQMLIENMTDREKEDMLLYVMRKANIPIKPKGEHAKIYWEEVEYTFDNVPSGRKYTHIFKLENIGKVPFKIEDISSSCGCTLANLPDKVIPPGGASSITVTFDASGKRRGEYTEFITVTGNTFPRKAVLIVYANIK